MTPYVHADIQQKHPSVSYNIVPFTINSIRNKTINKIDENERNINTLLFGNDQPLIRFFLLLFCCCYSPRDIAPN